MSAIVGRADDMLVIRGVNVYPSNIEHTLVGIAGVSPHFQLVVRREGTLDTLEVRVEPAAPDAQIDEREVEGALQSALGVSVTCTVEPEGAVPRSDGGKLNRVDDRRDLG